jgi:hypothetical protein
MAVPAQRVDLEREGVVLVAAREDAGFVPAPDEGRAEQ